MVLRWARQQRCSALTRGGVSIGMSTLELTRSLWPDGSRIAASARHHWNSWRGKEHRCHAMLMGAQPGNGRSNPSYCMHLGSRARTVVSGTCATSIVPRLPIGMQRIVKTRNDDPPGTLDMCMYIRSVYQRSLSTVHLDSTKHDRI